MDKKTTIYTAALQLIRDQKVEELTIELLSQSSGLSEEEILATSGDIASTLDMVIAMRWELHYQQSQHILQNPHPLQNLLAHDTAIINNINNFILAVGSKATLGRTAYQVLTQAKLEMPKYYQKILDSKQYLLPETIQDSELYAQFITHSIFFLTTKNLTNVLHAETTESEVTQQIIESLFPKAVLDY